MVVNPVVCYAKTCLALLLLSQNGLVKAIDCAPFRFVESDSTAAAHVPDARSFLVQVTHPSKRTSFVLGTFHSNAANVLARWDRIAVLMAAAAPRIFITEREFSEDSTGRVDARRLPEDQTLAQALGSPELHEAVLRELERSHAPAPMRSDYQPWFIATWLDQARARRHGGSGDYLDASLYRSARRLGLRTGGLETLAQLAEGYARLSLEEQSTLLAESICNSDHRAPLVDAFAAAYAANDVARFYRLFATLQTPNPEVADKLRRILIDERNDRFWQRIEPELELGGAFIAIGNLHVQGQGGVLEEARQSLAGQGYAVTDVVSVAMTLARERVADLVQWVLAWERKRHPRAAPEARIFDELAIEHEAATVLGNRLCPGKSCTIEATYDAAEKTLYLTSEIMMMLIRNGRAVRVMVNGGTLNDGTAKWRARPGYADSIVVRGLARHMLHAQATSVDSQQARDCVRSLALHHAARAQQAYLDERHAKAKAHFFPIKPGCLALEERLGFE